MNMYYLESLDNYNHKPVELLFLKNINDKIM